jgi:hypothetical protein
MSSILSFDVLFFFRCIICFVVMLTLNSPVYLGLGMGLTTARQVKPGFGVLPEVTLLDAGLLFPFPSRLLPLDNQINTRTASLIVGENNGTLQLFWSAVWHTLNWSTDRSHGAQPAFLN